MDSGYPYHLMGQEQPAWRVDAHHAPNPAERRREFPELYACTMADLREEDARLLALWKGGNNVAGKHLINVRAVLNEREVYEAAPWGSGGVAAHGGGGTVINNINNVHYAAPIYHAPQAETRQQPAPVQQIQPAPVPPPTRQQLQQQSAPQQLTRLNPAAIPLHRAPAAALPAVVRPQPEPEPQLTGLPAILSDIGSNIRTWAKRKMS